MRKILRTSEEVKEFVDVILRDEKVEIVALDTETTEFSDDRWCSIQMTLYGIGIYAGEKYQCYIVHREGIDYSPITELVEKKPIVFHNAKFDLQIFRNHFIVDHNTLFNELNDTMLLSFLQDEERNRHGLKYLAKELLKIEDSDIVKFKDVSKKPEIKGTGTLFEGMMDDNLEKETLEWEKTMGDYCMDDCRNTYDLYFLFKKKIEKEDVAIRKVYRELFIPFMQVLSGMEERGIKLDVEYLKDMELKVEDKLVDLGADIYKEAGRQFDINSSKQLSEILFNQFKYELTDEYQTPKGEKSTDAKALEYLVKTYDSNLCKKLLEYRELSKLQSTYIKGLPKLAIDGIVHTSFNQIGTITGRLSSNSPNLQNIPRRDDEFNIRKAFIPREGYCFVDADYSQLELRVMGFFSQDPKLLETYQTGGDIHKMTADTMGCSRVVAKGINFGLNYGRTAYGLSFGLGITVEEAEGFIKSYFENFPKVKEFMDKAINTIRSQRYIQTITKRRRRFKMYNKIPIKAGMGELKDLPDQVRKQLYRERDKNDKALERQAANTLIQGSAADIMNVAMRNMNAKLKKIDAHLLIQIHDEVLVECPLGKEDECVGIIQDCMENAIKLPGVPLVADPKVTMVREK